MTDSKASVKINRFAGKWLAEGIYDDRHRCEAFNEDKRVEESG